MIIRSRKPVGLDSPHLLCVAQLTQPVGTPALEPPSGQNQRVVVTRSDLSEGGAGGKVDGVRELRPGGVIVWW